MYFLYPVVTNIGSYADVYVDIATCTVILLNSFLVEIIKSIKLNYKVVM